MTLTENRPAGNASGASDAARRAMIDSQLRTSGVNEPWVLTAMSRVAREEWDSQCLRQSDVNSVVGRHVLPQFPGPSQERSVPVTKDRQIAQVGHRRGAAGDVDLRVANIAA